MISIEAPNITSDVVSGGELGTLGSTKSGGE